MNRQLDEMRTSRNLQSRPLPFLSPINGYLEKPKFWTGPPDFKAHIGYGLFFVFSAENIGQGPAISIDIHPTLLIDAKEKLVDKLTSAIKNIDSLKERERIKFYLMLVDEKISFVKAIVNHERQLSALKITSLFRNVLGGCFKTNALYYCDLKNTEKEKFKTCLKILQNAEIDYAKELQAQHKLIDEKREEEAYRAITELNKKFSSEVHCEKVPFEFKLWPGTFEVKPLTEEQYQKELETIGAKHRAATLCI